MKKNKYRNFKILKLKKSAKDVLKSNRLEIKNSTLDFELSFFLAERIVIKRSLKRLLSNVRRKKITRIKNFKSYAELKHNFFRQIEIYNNSLKK